MRIYRDRRFLIPFRSALLPQVFTDVLVVGTGVAGLRTAIEAARHGDVIVLAKEAVDLSNTSWAQGGIAAVLAADDTVESPGTNLAISSIGAPQRSNCERVRRTHESGDSDSRHSSAITWRP